MATVFSCYFKILTLDRGAYLALKENGESLWLSIRLFMILALIANLGSLAGIGQVIEEPTLVERLQQMASVARAEADRYPLLVGEWFQGIATILDQASANLVEIQPPLGVRPSRVVRLIGGWLNAPLKLLGGWMGAALAVWLAARMMGGRGSLRQHISLLLLAFAPQVLCFGRYLPAGLAPPQAVVGLLVVTTWVWSLIIGVYALAAAHDFAIRKALLVLCTSFFVFVMAIPEVIVLLLGVVGVITWKLIVP